MKITLFIPTKNEIRGLKEIMPRIKKEWVDEFIIIDAHSTDGTREYLESLGLTVTQQKKPGSIAAWWEGFEAATGDIIIPFSPDNNSIPEVIPLLIEKIKEGYDIAIASRYAKGAKSEDDSWLTAFGNKMFTSMINLFFSGHYTDALGMYKAFRKELFFSLKLFERRNEIFELIIAIRAAKKKLKIIDIPADEPARLKGDINKSRAWPGIFGRFKGGLYMLRVIFKEFLFWNF